MSEQQPTPTWLSQPTSKQPPRGVRPTWCDIGLVLLGLAGLAYDYVSKHLYTGVLWVFVGLLVIGGACLTIIDIREALRITVKRNHIRTKIVAIMLIRNLVVAVIIWLFIHVFYS